ncbi:MAG: class I SAM-dependent methyltransferase [Anaerolineae bacterium]|nr:class I SAM-dependent methyltransferase [Anaerolineae bacterium]
MIKYALTATALRTSSVSPFTKQVYRTLGNTLGAKNRTGETIPDHYFDRVNQILNLHRRHGIPKHGDRILEIGTGWVHWEGLICRLFFDVGGVLFDVWDNRQLSGLKRYVAELDARLDQLDVDADQYARAHHLIAQIQTVDSFDELYFLLGYEYVVDSTGKLSRLPSASFDMVISTAVFEHVNADIVADVIRDIARVLKPGGHSLQNIDLKDHLSYYDASASPKQYMRYSDAVWKRWFENDVQYINRIQRPEWHNMFSGAGLDLVEEHVFSVDINDIKVAQMYQHLDDESLTCGALRLLHRKPA